MMGGRIGFFEGQNLNTCAAKGDTKITNNRCKKINTW